MADILRLDSAGNPLHWIGQEEAACYYAKGLVAWTLGEPFRVLHGGRNRITGLRSHLDIHPVISVRGIPWTKWRVPALTNASMFRRDGHLCMYCGRQFRDHDLTRDHVIPTSKGGKDTWTNVVTACRLSLPSGLRVSRGNLPIQHYTKYFSTSELVRYTTSHYWFAF